MRLHVVLEHGHCVFTAIHFSGMEGRVSEVASSRLRWRPVRSDGPGAHLSAGYRRVQHVSQRFGTQNSRRKVRGANVRKPPSTPSLGVLFR